MQRQHSDSSPQSEESSNQDSGTASETHAASTITGQEEALPASERLVIPHSMPQFINYEHMRLPKFAWPLCAALAYHGLMQGTVCDSCMDDIQSPTDYLLLPAPLRPSSLQLAVKHRNWIDRFPFPHLRDNMILLADRISLDSFVYDLFNIPSLTLRHEGEKCTWSPTSWRMERDFGRKWGYLFMSQVKLFATTPHAESGRSGVTVRRPFCD